MPPTVRPLADFSDVPLVDIQALRDPSASARSRHQVAAALGQACREVGFFYIVGHGIDEQLFGRLEDLSRQFFAQSLDEKMRIAMSRGGRAWRGYFPVGQELTSGRPDRKEGLYLGLELDVDHPDVVAGTPLHGQNLFPEIPGFRQTILEYLAATTRVGHQLMAGLALSLGLESNYFALHYTGDPLVLFRIFNYPSALQSTQVTDQPEWGVGEHTDYGLITILKQDDTGGLQVKSRTQWIDAPPIPGSFICNLGDMLERLTRGLYRSTPHRVLNLAGGDRLSYPIFFDPNFHAAIRPIEQLAGLVPGDDSSQRWDHANVHSFEGTYGQYLLNKVSKVFPQLQRDVW